MISMLDSDGNSCSSDARGVGCGRGEGIATIVLKRLGDALNNQDPIRAVIRATAINQDGRTAGLTKSSSQAQVNLHRFVFANSNLCPEDIGYVEAHGTGTLAGDLAEIEAISEVYQTNPEHPLYVGCIKSNLGYLEATSGLAGLIKAILILENKLIPPNADFGNPKPSLDFVKQGIIVRRSSPWRLVWQLTVLRYTKSRCSGAKPELQGSLLTALAMAAPMGWSSWSKRLHLYKGP